MALVIPFDTLAFVKELEIAGVPATQAEAQAKVLASTLQKVEEAHRVDFATKGDIELLKREREDLSTKGDILRLERDIKELDVKLESRIKELDAKIETTKAELRRDIEASKVEIIKWVVGASGAIVALIKLLPGGH